MNKTLKKIIAIVLSVMMILSVTSVSLAAEEVPHEDHPTMFSLISTFFWEVVEFFRYIFYGVWLGEPGPSVIPPAPTDAVVTTVAA